jgi:hypothetical protein
MQGEAASLAMSAENAPRKHGGRTRTNQGKYRTVGNIATKAD